MLLLKSPNSTLPHARLSRSYKAAMRRRFRFRRLAHAIGAREPDSPGNALMLSWEGLMLSWEGSDLSHLILGQHGPVSGCRHSRACLDPRVSRVSYRL
jgi:hypothetical protein